MFSEIFSKFFKRKKEKENKVIVNHTHKNVDEFIASFNDDDLDMLRSELIGCELGAIPDRIEEILSYLKGRCTDEDLKWYAEEIKKEYKK